MSTSGQQITKPPCEQGGSKFLVKGSSSTFGFYGIGSVLFLDLDLEVFLGLGFRG
jgi:hypothetical protein